jgi:hypothetical protein
MVGGPGIIRMEPNGWTKTTVKPGDVITGIGYQPRLCTQLRCSP